MWEKMFERLARRPMHTMVKLIMAILTIHTSRGSGGLYLLWLTYMAILTITSRGSVGLCLLWLNLL